MGRNPKWWKDPVLVTVLAAVVTGAWVVGSRMSSIEAGMIDRFGAMEVGMIDRFGAMEVGMIDRFGALEARIAALEARVAALGARMDLLLEGLDITVTPRKQAFGTLPRQPALAGIQLETSRD